MRFGCKWTWIGLAVVLVLVAYGAYELNRYRRGSFHYRAAQEALERRDFRQADVHLKKCLAAWPTDPEVRLLAAQNARRQGNYSDARQHLAAYERKAGRTDALILEERLIQMQGKGDLSGADSLLAHCADHADAAETPVALEGLLLASTKVLAGAAAEGTALEGGEAAADVARALRAVELWLRLRQSKVDQAQGIVWRGLINGYAGRHSDAAVDLRKALELNPEHFDARMHLAVALALEAPAEAAVHLEILRHLEPSKREVRFSLATVRRTLGELDEAAKLLDELLAANPDDVPTLIERAYVAINAKKPDEAERWLRKALALAPDEPEVHMALSGCLQKAGKLDEAKKHQDQVPELDRRRKQLRQEQARKTREAVQP